MPALRIRVTGTVQGVFFRAGAEYEAKRLGLRGWAENMGDGSVEFHAEGKAAALAEFADWCRHGPEAAQVDGFEQREVPEEKFRTFEIRR